MRTLKKFIALYDSVPMQTWEISSNPGFGYGIAYQFMVNGRVEKETDDVSLAMYYLGNAMRDFLLHEQYDKLRIEGVTDSHSS